jgi:hypothetical protein
MNTLLFFHTPFPSLSIFELEAQHVPHVAPNAHRYQWFMIGDARIEPLTFLRAWSTVDDNRLINHREFVQGRLSWNAEGEAEWQSSSDSVVSRLERKK